MKALRPFFAGKIEETYYAVDINEALLEVVERKAEAKGLDNLVTFPSIAHFLEGMTMSP